jgi:hypothetical protein
LKQWLKSLIADDKKNLKEVEKQIETASQRFSNEVWRNVENQIDLLTGDTVDPLENRAQYDRILREAEYQANREIDVLRAGIIGAIITRVSASNRMWDGVFNFNFDPLTTVQSSIIQLDNKIFSAKNDALDRIAGFIEMAKQTRSNRDVVKRSARQRIGMLGTFTDFVADSTLYEADRRIREKQFDLSDAELLLYDGPDDSVIRDWCELHVGKAAVREYWETAENDVGPQPPLLFGGGWSCRHRLIPVKREWLTNEEVIE